MKLTKQQALKRIELALIKMEELKKYIEQEDKEWPQVGDEYWMLCPNGPAKYYWDNNHVDQAYLELGEACRTKEECQKKYEKRKAIVRVKNYIKENFGEFLPDWNNHGQTKHTIHYNHESKSFCGWRFAYLQYPSPIGYLRTAKDRNQLIKDCEEDLKIIWDITN